MEDTPTKNSLPKEVYLTDSIKFGKELIFDGNLEGKTTSADGVLTNGENGNVRGCGIKDVAVAQKEELQKIGAPR